MESTSQRAPSSDSSACFDSSSDSEVETIPDDTMEHVDLQYLRWLKEAISRLRARNQRPGQTRIVQLVQQIRFANFLPNSVHIDGLVKRQIYLATRDGDLFQIHGGGQPEQQNKRRRSYVDTENLRCLREFSVVTDDEVKRAVKMALREIGEKEGVTEERIKNYIRATFLVYTEYPLETVLKAVLHFLKQNGDVSCNGPFYALSDHAGNENSSNLEDNVADKGPTTSNISQTTEETNPEPSLKSRLRSRKKPERPVQSRAKGDIWADTGGSRVTDLLARDPTTETPPRPPENLRTSLEPTSSPHRRILPRDPDGPTVFEQIHGHEPQASDVRNSAPETQVLQAGSVLVVRGPSGQAQFFSLEVPALGPCASQPPGQGFPVTVMSSSVAISLNPQSPGFYGLVLGAASQPGSVVANHLPGSSSDAVESPPGLSALSQQFYNSALQKAQQFFIAILASCRNQMPVLYEPVRNLLQNLVDGKINPDVFVQRLQEDLRAGPPPILAPLLKSCLCVLRAHLASRDIIIEGIRPPSLAALALTDANLTISNAAPPAQDIQPDSPVENQGICQQSRLPISEEEDQEVIMSEPEVLENGHATESPTVPCPWCECPLAAKDLTDHLKSGSETAGCLEVRGQLNLPDCVLTNQLAVLITRSPALPDDDRTRLDSLGYFETFTAAQMMAKSKMINVPIFVVPQSIAKIMWGWAAAEEPDSQQVTSSCSNFLQHPLIVEDFAEYKGDYRPAEFCKSWKKHGERDWSPLNEWICERFLGASYVMLKLENLMPTSQAGDTVFVMLWMPRKTAIVFDAKGLTLSREARAARDKMVFSALDRLLKFLTKRFHNQLYADSVERWDAFVHKPMTRYVYESPAMDELVSAVSKNYHEWILELLILAFFHRCTVQDPVYYEDGPEDKVPQLFLKAVQDMIRLLQTSKVAEDNNTISSAVFWSSLISWALTNSCYQQLLEEPSPCKQFLASSEFNRNKESALSLPNELDGHLEHGCRFVKLPETDFKVPNSKASKRLRKTLTPTTQQKPSPDKAPSTFGARWSNRIKPTNLNEATPDPDDIEIPPALPTRTATRSQNKRKISPQRFISPTAENGDSAESGPSQINVKRQRADLATPSKFGSLMAMREPRSTAKNPEFTGSSTSSPAPFLEKPKSETKPHKVPSTPLLEKLAPRSGDSSKTKKVEFARKSVAGLPLGLQRSCEPADATSSSHPVTQNSISSPIRKLAVPVPRKSAPEYKCLFAECVGFATDDLNAIKDHVREHLDLCPYRCYHCLRGFTCLRALNVHTEIMMVKLMKCVQCDYKSDEQGDMHRHLQDEHFDLPKFRVEKLMEVLQMYDPANDLRSWGDYILTL